MATTITMPQLGETVTEGTVAQWLKKPGEAVEKYEPFVEVSTDKVNAEVPSPVTGVLREIITREGETVPTGAPIAIIDEAGVAGVVGDASADGAPLDGAPLDGVPLDGAPLDGAPANGASQNGASSNGMAASGTAAGGATSAGATNGNAPGARASEALRGMSPAVRRLAREHRVDLAAVRGTGQHGRVTAADVLAAAQQSPVAASPAAVAVAPPAAPAAPPRVDVPQTRPAQPEAGALPAGRSTYAAPQPGTLVPLSQARKIIAQRMVESLATAPHAWTMVEVDVTQLWTWRNREKERFARDHGYPLTLLPFFIYAVVRALKEWPLLNARYTDAGIVVEGRYDVGIAIGSNANLVVPVVRDADTLSIAGLALAAGRLIERARSGKLGADDLSGGTFTVNNTGANGSVLSKPIINGGQAGIVTMEAVVKRPVVIDDAIAIRSMMNVCLSLDHRVLDGTIANGFTATLKKRLEAMGPAGDL